MIYIYLKTHNITGLQYLGKTERDPYKYNGSGTYWLNHLRKHGFNIKTEILAECKTLEEAKLIAAKYSKELDIVASKKFANLVEEAIDGQPKGVKLDIYTPDRNLKVSAGVKANWNKNKEKRSAQNKGRTWKLDEKTKHRVSTNLVKYNSETAKICANTIWINNGIKNKRIKKDQQLPEGFFIGRMFTPWNKKVQ
jgi:hypothetical protein